MRTRLLGRALGWTWLGLLSVTFVGLGLWLVLDPGDGAAPSLPWMAWLLLGAAGLACALSLVWLGARLRRRSLSALRRLEREDALLAEEVTSALELSLRPEEGSPTAAAFVGCHRQVVKERLAAIPPAALVPLTGVAQLSHVAALVGAVLVLTVAVVPEAPSRLAAAMGLTGGADSLPLVLGGPAARPLRVEVSPPGYTGLPTAVVAPSAPSAPSKASKAAEAMEAPIRVPDGAMVTVLLDAEHPVRHVRALTPEGTLITGEPLGESAVRVRFRARGNGELVLGLEDTDGVWRVGARGPAFEIQPDRPPTVTLRPDTAVIRQETPSPITLSFEAEDDHGLTAVRLVYTMDGGHSKEVVLARGPQMGPGRQQRLSGVYRWDLTTLRLAGGSRVRFHLEAEDNRSLAGAPPSGQRTRSPSQEIRIEGARQARLEVLEGVRRLLGSTLDALADRYEQPWHRAPPEGCGEALRILERQQANELALSTELSAFVTTVLNAPQILPPVLREVLQGELTTLGERLGATTRADRALRPRAPSCQPPGPGHRASAQVVETLEELALQLDALTGRATLEEMQDVVDHIESLRKEIRHLTEALRAEASEEKRRALAERTQELRRQVARLGRLAASLGDEVMDEHVNQYALREERRDAFLDKLGKAGQTGASRSDPLDALDRMVSQLKEAVGQGLDRFRQVMPLRGEAARQREAQGLRSLAEAQRHLNESLDGAGDPRDLAERQRALSTEAERLARSASEERGKLPDVPPRAGPSAKKPQDPAETEEGSGDDAAKTGGPQKAEAKEMSTRSGRLKEVSRKMEEAAEALGRGEKDAARQKSAEALRALEGLRKALEREGRLTPPPGREGDDPHDRGAVDVPAAGGALPRTLRESIQEAGRSPWPKPYAGSLRRYYERLLR